jgi:hypothetical protein
MRDVRQEKKRTKRATCAWMHMQQRVKRGMSTLQQRHMRARVAPYEQKKKKKKKKEKQGVASAAKQAC